MSCRRVMDEGFEVVLERKPHLSGWKETDGRDDSHSTPIDECPFATPASLKSRRMAPDPF